MVKPIDIALVAHEICLTTLISSYLSPEHDFPTHLDTSRVYAEAFNDAGLEDADAKDIVKAIVNVTGWDMVTKWPGHPATKDVIEHYKANYR
jgi:hypothetical protein